VRFTIGAALALVVLAGAAASGGEPVCGLSGRSPEQQRALINRFDDHLGRERTRHGLDRVAFSHTLSVVAEEYAHLLDRHDRFDHIGPDGSTPATRVKAAGYCFRFVAENLARGVFTSAKDLFQAWMNSPGHRDAMMHKSPKVYGLAANCPPRRRRDGDGGYPAGSIAGLMEKGGALKDATLGANPGAGRPEIFVMLLALPC